MEQNSGKWHKVCMVLPISLLFEQNLPPFRAASAGPYRYPSRVHDPTTRSVHQLLPLAINDWCLARDQSLTSAVAFVDLSKAFDRVQHSSYSWLCTRLVSADQHSHGLNPTFLAEPSGSSGAVRSLHFYLSLVGSRKAVSWAQLCLTSMSAAFLQLLTHPGRNYSLLRTTKRCTHPVRRQRRLQI